MRGKNLYAEAVASLPVISNPNDFPVVPPQLRGGIGGTRVQLERDETWEFFNSQKMSDIPNTTKFFPIPGVFAGQGYVVSEKPQVSPISVGNIQDVYSKIQRREVMDKMRNQGKAGR